MSKESILEYEKAHESAEHYNIMIWTVFGIGVALSLWILLRVWPFKTDFGAMQFFMSILGFLVLFYCILAIESFNQKKTLMYKIFNRKTKESNLEQKINKLPYCRIEWIAEIILFGIFLAYVFLFWFIWNNNSLGTFGIKIMFLAPVMFVISIILLFIIVVNWILSPGIDNGNLLERSRRFIFGGWVKGYDEIFKEAQN